MTEEQIAALKEYTARLTEIRKQLDNASETLIDAFEPTLPTWIVADMSAMFMSISFLRDECTNRIAEWK